MNNRDLKIATNVMALAARRKGKAGKNKRSTMLRMVMPFLSRETGDALADAIDTGNSHKFTNTWNRVRDEIANKIGHHRAHAGEATAGVVVNIEADEQTVQKFLNLYEDFGRYLSSKS